MYCGKVGYLSMIVGKWMIVDLFFLFFFGKKKEEEEINRLKFLFKSWSC